MTCLLLAQDTQVKIVCVSDLLVIIVQRYCLRLDTYIIYPYVIYLFVQHDDVNQVLQVAWLQQATD